MTCSPNRLISFAGWSVNRFAKIESILAFAKFIYYPTVSTFFDHFSPFPTFEEMIYI